MESWADDHLVSVLKTSFTAATADGEMEDAVIALKRSYPLL